MVFCPSAEAAEAAATPLRKSLWGAHNVAVLLPDGKEAVRIMQDFKNQRTTLLLCTPEVERGLDMPGIDHVYSLDAPGSSASYLHRAGRCGRVGASSSGCVTAVVSPEEEAALDQCMLDLELRDWEALEEETNAPPPMTMVGEATIADARKAWVALGEREGLERHYWKQDGGKWVEQTPGKRQDAREP